MAYVIRDRKHGWIIDRCETWREAEDLLREFEAEDRANGKYEPDFYEIVEVDE